MHLCNDTVMESANAMELFLAVVDAGSFAAAARSLSVPTSTVTRRINRLEERLGALLLQRTTRKLTPTSVGQAYYQRCRQIVADIAETEAAIASMQSEPRGTLRLAAPPGGGLGPLIARFMERYPQVDVEVAASTRYVDLIEEGYDVALRAGPLRDPRLSGRRLMHTRGGAVASRRYLDAHGRPTDPAQLADHECLASGAPATRLRWPLLSGGVIEVRARLTTNDMQIARDAVLHDQGIAFLPLVFVHEELASSEVEQVLPEHLGRLDGLYIAYPSNRYLSAKVRAFVDFVADSIDDMELPGAEAVTVG